jgi:Protein of unknown function (DUF1573)
MAWVLPLLMFGQKGKLDFPKTVHPFGDIQEEKGLAVAVFHFTNVGTGPIVVTSVKSSCGCTTPTWTKDTLPPGESGLVKVAYDPANRPGKFSKGVTLTTNGTPDAQELKITGNVIPRERGPHENYPFAEGNIRFKTNHITLGPVYNDEIKQQFTTLYNDGKVPIIIDLAHTQKPRHVLLSIDNATIKPGGTASLIIKYSGKHKADFGLLMDQIFLKTNDKDKPLKPLYITADIRERFDPAATAVPVVKYESPSLDLGTQPIGPELKASFKLSNTGKAPLLIRKVDAPCSCMDVAAAKTSLEPGESTTVDITFRTVGRSGRQIKEIVVITNAPGNPVQTLKLTAVLGE